MIMIMSEDRDVVKVKNSTAKLKIIPPSGFSCRVQMSVTG
jgi:hypothetical protein